MQKLKFLKSNSARLRKVFGSIIILGAGLAAAFDAGWLNAAAPEAANPMLSSTTTNAQLIGALSAPYPAPPLKDGPNDWINSPPLSLNALKGKVVLIDFWTYSCINCVRTLPYLNNWYAQYHNQGLVVIGVHTPEFAFEKNPTNVAQAVKEDGILYPVLIDSNYSTWLSFNNQYWPAHYLIDKQGKVVYTHFGEGNYAETEHNIRVLLGLNADQNVPAANSAATPFSTTETPETYLGSARADATQSFWSTQGRWTSQEQYIVSAAANASISLNFNAKNVYLVGGAEGAPITVQVFLNGKKIKSLSLGPHNLYPLLSLPTASAGTLELVFAKPGAELYTFTFGN